MECRVLCDDLHFGRSRLPGGRGSCRAVNCEYVISVAHGSAGASPSRQLLRKQSTRAQVATLIILICLMAVGPTICAAEPGFVFVGSSSCATFGCHGNSVTRSPEAWKSSFATWTRTDPHARAFEVLYTERSVKMISLLLEPLDVAGAEYEAGYWRVLEKRCIGCHATPAAVMSHQADSSFMVNEALRGGVSCESCHGAASHWLAEHATSRWTGYSAEEKSKRWGQTNTRDLSVRAALCVECHMGPKQGVSGGEYDVTHELISAGHPRLRFEFSAYLANLPPHWNESKDRSRTGRQETFHFDAWRIGQVENARKLVSQLADRSSQPEGFLTDFSNYDCYACHHPLRVDRIPQAENATAVLPRPGLPRAADWPFAHLQAIASTKESLRTLQQPLTDARRHLRFGSAELQANRQRLLVALGDSIAGLSQLLQNEKRSVRENGRILAALLADVLAEKSIDWDRAVQFNLALAAFVEDYEPGEVNRTSGVAIRARELATYLDGHFNHKNEQSGSIYDSPSGFNPEDKNLRDRLRAIAKELESIR